MIKEHHQCKVYCAHDCKSDNICVQTLVFNCDVQIIIFFGEQALYNLGHLSYTFSCFVARKKTQNYLKHEHFTLK